MGSGTDSMEGARLGVGGRGGLSLLGSVTFLLDDLEQKLLSHFAPSWKVQRLGSWSNALFTSESENT